MKQFLLMFSVFVLAGCSGGGGGEQPQPSAEIKIDVPTIELSTPDVGNASATFTSNVAWSISLSDTKAAPTWLSVDKTSGGAGTHTINISIVEPNPSVTDSRTGYVKIAVGDKVGVITVVQPKGIPVNVTGVTLNKTGMTLETGKSEVLTAIIAPANATNKTVTWKSDDETVATVTGGTITAKKPGNTVITVTTEDGDKTATCAVEVKKPVDGDGTITDWE